MSRETLDFVRSLVAPWERGDFSSAEWAHPEIEFVFADGPTPGTWRGLAEMNRGFRELLSAFEGYRAKAEEYREIDDERVLVLISRSGRGRTSGVKLEGVARHAALIFHLSGGRVTRLILYFDRNRAFADLGLADAGVRE